MKVKKFNKKLELNKQTVANLRVNEMKAAQGGAFTEEYTCPCIISKPDICDTWYLCGQSAFYYCTQAVCRTEPC